MLSLVWRTPGWGYERAGPQPNPVSAEEADRSGDADRDLVERPVGDDLLDAVDHLLGGHVRTTLETESIGFLGDPDLDVGSTNIDCKDAFHGSSTSFRGG